MLGGPYTFLWGGGQLREGIIGRVGVCGQFANTTIRHIARMQGRRLGSGFWMGLLGGRVGRKEMGEDDTPGSLGGFAGGLSATK